MQSVFIFHGTGGSPKGNWFPWLKQKLEAPNREITIPRFPNPDAPSLKAWLNTLEPYQSQIGAQTILIGHSLGGLFLLRLLERLDQPVKAAVFVSAPVGIRPIRYYEGDERFTPGFDFDWSKIRSAAQNFVAYHSDNDPYISLSNGEELAKQLGITLTFIPHAGHLNAESGYVTFDKLLEDLKPFLYKV